MKRLIAAALLVFYCGHARADVPELPPASPAVNPDPALYLESGEPAPFDGILISEARALTFAQLRIEAEELRLRVQVREAEITRLTIPSEEPGWLARNEFFLGVFGGIALSALLAFGSVKLVDLLD